MSLPTALAWGSRQSAAPAAWGLSAPIPQPTTVGLWDYAKPKDKAAMESGKTQGKVAKCCSYDIVVT